MPESSVLFLQCSFLSGTCRPPNRLPRLPPLRHVLQPADPKALPEMSSAEHPGVTGSATESEKEFLDRLLGYGEIVASLLLAVLRARQVAYELNEEITGWTGAEAWSQRVALALRNTLQSENLIPGEAQPVAARLHRTAVFLEGEDETMQDSNIEDMLDASAITVKVTAREETLKPWPHQRSAWNSLDGHYVSPEQSDGGRAGILVVPTGGGKTWLACNWLLRNHVANGGRVLWLTHRHSLLRQSFKVFARNASLASGLTQLRLVRVSSQDLPFSAVGADDHLVFATIQSAARNESYVTHMAEQSPKGLFVVVDEAHHAAAPTYRKLLEGLKEFNARLLGLTATPIRTDEGDQARLQQIFASKILYQVSMADLIQSGILAHPSPVTVKTEIEFERDFDEKDFKHLERFGELSQRVLNILAKHAHRNKLIVKHYREQTAQYGKTIVFAANILHARTLCKEFNNHGVQADYVDSCRSQEENQKAMDSFCDPAGIPVIVNVEMLTEGFDAPITRTVFIARPTASEILLRQMIGRALRGPSAGGEEKAYLVTFMDTWSTFPPLPSDYFFKEDLQSTVEPPGKPHRGPTVPIPPELLWEAYRRVTDIIKHGKLTYFECLPHSWYSWDEELEDDVIRRHVLVFENQAEAYTNFHNEILEKRESIPEDVTDGFAEKILRDYFCDTPDPQPSVHDLKILLSAFKRGNEVARYTLSEKQKADPKTVALDVVKQNLGFQDWKPYVLQFFESHPLCAAFYPGESGGNDYCEECGERSRRFRERLGCHPRQS